MEFVSNKKFRVNGKKVKLRPRSPAPTKSALTTTSHRLSQKRPVAENPDKCSVDVHRSSVASSSADSDSDSDESESSLGSEIRILHNVSIVPDIIIYRSHSLPSVSDLSTVDCSSERDLKAVKDEATEWLGKAASSFYRPDINFPITNTHLRHISLEKYETGVSFKPTSIAHALRSLKLEELKLEELFLLQKKMRLELERLRKPRRFWYEFRDSRFCYECHRNTEYLKHGNQLKQAVNEKLVEYNRLEKSADILSLLL